jgi:hypothetical protein
VIPPCADVTGDGRVTLRDALCILHAIQHHSQDPRYDLNHDDRVTTRDLMLVIRQIGRRCRR